VAAAAPLTELLHQSGDGSVPDDLDPALSALRLVVEDDLVAGDGDVALPHRRDAVGLIFLRVVLGPDPEKAAVEKPDSTGKHPLAGDVALAQVPLHLVPQLGERPTEVEHRAELLLVSTLAPAVVVAVLLASPRVHAGRLDVAHGIGADPDLLPGRRDREGFDALDDVRVVDALAGASIYVLETPPPPPARDAR
jgi:hypothetical protein